MEDHVPLVHTPYPGDVPDPTAFGQALDRLDQRYRPLTGDPLIIVCDQGNVSQANMTAVWGRGWSVVSTLVPRHHQDLLAVPRTAYTPADPTRWPDLLAYTEDRTVYGRPGRVVVTYTPALWEGQLRGFRHQQLQIETGIRTLQTRPARWRTAPPRGGRRPPAWPPCSAAWPGGGSPGRSCGGRARRTTRGR